TVPMEHRGGYKRPDGTLGRLARVATPRTQSLVVRMVLVLAALQGSARPASKLASRLAANPSPHASGAGIQGLWHTGPGTTGRGTRAPNGVRGHEKVPVQTPTSL